MSPRRRAGQQLAATLGVLLEDALDRRAALARHALRVPGQADAYRVLGEEHRDLFALGCGGLPDEKRDEYAFGVLHAGREVDHDFVAHDFTASSEMLVTPYFWVALSARSDTNRYSVLVRHSWIAKPASSIAWR